MECTDCIHYHVCSAWIRQIKEQSNHNGEMNEGDMWDSWHEDYAGSCENFDWVI